MSDIRFRAITTRYKGYAFRSRLEARWAVFFDHLGIRWEYEPEGFELGNGLRYLPDFWLPDWGLWVEVKPDAPDVTASEKAQRLVQLKGRPVYTTCGMPGVNGVLVFLDESHDAVEVPAYAYFDASCPSILAFTTVEPSCARTWPTRVDFTDYDEQLAKKGARLRGRYQAALYAARAARFEHGQEGA